MHAMKTNKHATLMVATKVANDAQNAGQFVLGFWLTILALEQSDHMAKSEGSTNFEREKSVVGKSGGH